MRPFKRIFRRVRDPRAPNASHHLVEILLVALAATLCGAKGAADFAEFGRAKEAALRRFLRLPHGIPSHDTFSRVFRLLDPASFERAMRRFMAAFAKAHGLALSGVVAIDGKALRGAYQRGARATPLHMVNVFATEARLVVAARLARGRNETAGALEVLAALLLNNCIVSADALHCNRAFAVLVLKRGGDYVLALKKNQRKLFDAVARRFARAGPRSSAERREASTHDRCEARRATVIRDANLARTLNFPGVVAIARITSRRRPSHGRAEPVAVRYYLLSKYLPAGKLLRAVRSHWAIENNLHWMLDVVFAEDACRARCDHAAENLAILRRLAITIIRQHPEAKSMRRKILRAGWDDAFLFSLLAHMR